MTKIKIKKKRASAFKKFSKVEGKNGRVHRKECSGVKKGVK